MKRLTTAQIGLGCLIVFFSFVSATSAYWISPPRGGIIGGPNGIPIAIAYTYPPQSPGFAWATAVTGLVVVVCGVFQQKMAIKYSRVQIFMGIISTIASAILGFTISDNPWISGNIHYLSVATLIFGAIVAVLGFLQSRLRNFSKYVLQK
jgi:hypothetical protein